MEREDFRLDLRLWSLMHYWQLKSREVRRKTCYRRSCSNKKAYEKCWIKTWSLINLANDADRILCSLQCDECKHFLKARKLKRRFFHRSALESRSMLLIDCHFEKSQSERLKCAPFFLFHLLWLIRNTTENKNILKICKQTSQKPSKAASSEVCVCVSVYDNEQYLIIKEKANKTKTSFTNESKKQRQENRRAKRSDIWLQELTRHSEKQQ